jgi:predicted TPR repeat methyltransferase
VANPASLDLYAKVEDLLGVMEVSPKLYAHYLLFLQTRDFESLLDVGCGSGDFLLQMQNALGIAKVKGIDLSPLMVEKTQAKGLDAHCVDLSKLDEKYDVITAVFDMLNYLSPKALEDFGKAVKGHLNDGGIFLCDINTLYGFEEVAVGSFIVDDDERFLSIDSDYEEGVYTSEFTLFEKEKHCFKKSKECIKQYLHSIKNLEKALGLTCLVNDEVRLYELEEADKRFLVFASL